MENVLKILYLIGLIGRCVGEVAVNQSPSFDWASYSIEHKPAAEYGPPSTPAGPASTTDPAIEYGAPPISTAAFEVPEENLEYTGHVIEVNTPAHQSTFTHFLPSEQFGQLKKPTPSPKIFLPKENPPVPFHSVALNAGEVFTQQSAQLKLHQPTAFFASTQHLPQFQEIKQFRPVVANIYGPPTAVENPHLNPNPYAQPVQPVAPAPCLPSTQPSSPPPRPDTDETVDVADTNDDNDNHNNDNDPTDPTVIAAANANGQYYILGKDNTLQRVIYQTHQSKDDSINNGFTAHLRYSLVEPIRDPIYGYDDQGHLVRIYNKK